MKNNITERTNERSLSDGIKIISINFLLFILLFHVADFYISQRVYNMSWIYNDESKNKISTYIKRYRKFHNYNIFFNSFIANNEILNLPYTKENKKCYRGEFRPIENKKANKSIIIFGCSYAYGSQNYELVKMLNSETFSYQLGKVLPNYRIVNRAYLSWTTSHMLYQLENKDFSNIPNVKYVLYVFIPDHIVRNDFNYMWFLHAYPYYKLKSDNINLEKYSIKYMEIPLVKYIAQMKREHFYKNIHKNVNKVKLTKKIIEKSKFESELKFGTDVKFIILRYDNDEEEPYNYMFEELKEEGFIVLSLKDLSDTDYLTPKYQISKTDPHPNDLVWKEITPLFVKYLQDRGYFKD